MYVFSSLVLTVMPPYFYFINEEIEFESYLGDFPRYQSM